MRLDLEGNTTKLPEVIVDQLIDYVETQEHLIRRLTPEVITFLRQRYYELLTERYQRGLEAASLEVVDAVDEAESVIKYPWYMRLCVDGRVNPTLLFMFIAGMRGGAIQTPAGDTTDYKEKQGGGVILEPKSETARDISEAFQHDDIAYTVFDSHCACAKQKLHCHKTGQNTSDGGLFADVIRKKANAQATTEYVKKYHPNKEMRSVLVSFDPHDGYMWSGLETDEALSAAREYLAQKTEKPVDERYGAFEPELLEKLADEGKIVSTKRLAEQYAPLFAAELEKFPDWKPDWKNDFARTAGRCWIAFGKVLPSILPKVTQDLAKIGDYARLSYDDLEQRATMLLTNAFGGFCNSYQREEYPYSTHQEDSVEIASRTYGPYPRHSTFVVSPNPKTVGEDTVFTGGIIRDSRAKGVVTDAPDMPIPAIALGVVPDEYSHEEWELLEQIDWSFITDSNDWMTMEIDSLRRALLRKNKNVHLPAQMLYTLLELLETVRAVHSNESGQSVNSGQQGVLPVITDRNRRPRFIPPFFQTEFTRKPVQERPEPEVEERQPAKRIDVLGFILARVTEKGVRIQTPTPNLGTAEIPVTVDGDLSGKITSALNELRIVLELTDDEAGWRQTLGMIREYAQTMHNATSAFRESDEMLNWRPIVWVRRMLELIPKFRGRIQEDQEGSAFMAAGGQFTGVLLSVINAQLGRQDVASDPV